jgi:hypothetical protein
VRGGIARRLRAGNPIDVCRHFGQSGLHGAARQVARKTYMFIVRHKATYTLP